MMKNMKKDFLSIQIARVFMKAAGFWPAKSKIEERFLNGIVGFSIWVVASAFWVQGTELYLDAGDFHATVHTACSSMPLIIIFLKVTIFFLYRKKVLGIIRYTEDNFWYAQFDEYGNKILENINKKGIILMCTFMFFVQGTLTTIILTPVIENRGRNESDRILPFNIWIGISTTVSPNFEIIFIVESLLLSHGAGVLFCCFDNLLCLLNLQAAGQFKILQHRLETILETVEASNVMFNAKQRHGFYEKIRECVIFHHELIRYSENMEQIFMYPTFGQLLITGTMLCVATFQVFESRGTIIRRLIFIAQTIGAVFQLFVVTSTSNVLMDESSAVGNAVYNTNWQVLSHEEDKGIRKTILMMMMRASRACCISAGGFFPVSLETFMTVLSTAASYFTLLHNFVE